ncbi:MAG: hypothetical protein AB1345_04260 [Chloroflexota bacterium]
MKKISNVILKIIAFLFALILVFATPLSLLAYDVGRVVFNPPLVKDIVTDEVVNSDLLPAALAWFSEWRAKQLMETTDYEVNVDIPDILKIITFMQIEHWRGVKLEVLTNEILESWVSTTVDGTYEWIDSDERVPQITLAMKPFKDRVNSEHGTRSLEIVYSALPPCIQIQIDDFLSRLDAAPPGKEVLYNLCQFPDPWHEDQFSDYLESLLHVVNSIPDEFNMTDTLSKSTDTATGVGPEAIKQELRLIRLFLNLAPLIIVVLLFCVLVFGIRSLIGLGRWWGVPLTLGGLLALLPTLVYRYVITTFLASGPLSEVPELIMEEAIRAILRLASEIFRPMMWQSFIVLLLGLFLIIFAAIVQRRQAPAPEETNQT